MIIILNVLTYALIYYIELTDRATSNSHDVTSRTGEIT